MLTLGALYWLLYIVGLIFTGYRERGKIVDSLFWWVMLFILGWAEFGFPIK